MNEMSHGKDVPMRRPARRGWLIALVPVVLCVPCLVGPLLVLGGAAGLASAARLLTDTGWVVAAILVLGAVFAGALLTVRRRRGRTVCCPPTPVPECAAHEPTEVRQ